ncbi:hypothetical protein BV898_02315 [Hypsibius exemplaris]|uniref:Uncharacterized protein n=1 Tax=Hypsibius exemplaris TaxID=2072580 RepID=A0A1W0X8V7_HYPEX|nr:hypothetical protein BV898_02315 [Hypsibius exemplaris]
MYPFDRLYQGERELLPLVAPFLFTSSPSFHPLFFPCSHSPIKDGREEHDKRVTELTEAVGLRSSMNSASTRT